MKPWVTAPSGMTLAATLKRYDGAYAGYRYNASTEDWEASPSYADSRVPLSEQASEYAGYYEAASDLDGLGSPTGNIRIFIHDESASNRVVATVDVPIVDGEVVSQHNLTDAMLLDGVTVGNALLNMLAKLCGTSDVQNGVTVVYKSPKDGSDVFSEVLSSSVPGKRTSVDIRES